VFAQHPRSNLTLRELEKISHKRNHPIQSTSIQNNENEPDYYSSEDDIDLIEKYETRYFIQDCMMYKPFSIFPPTSCDICIPFRYNAFDGICCICDMGGLK